MPNRYCEGAVAFFPGEPLVHNGFEHCVNRSALTPVRADRVEAGGTLAPTAIPRQTARGQRNEDDLGQFHERTSRASVMLRSGGAYILSSL